MISNSRTFIRLRRIKGKTRESRSKVRRLIMRESLMYKNRTRKGTTTWGITSKRRNASAGN